METKTFFTFLPSEACGPEKTGNRETMKIEAITKENLPRCRELILPYIYEELENYEGDPAAEYISVCNTTKPARTGLLRRLPR